MSIKQQMINSFKIPLDPPLEKGEDSLCLFEQVHNVPPFVKGGLGGISKHQKDSSWA